MEKFNVYSMVNDRIISALEQGVIPWKKPWKPSDGYINLITKHAYQGANLWMMLALNHERPYYLTYRQAKEIGANIRKGAVSIPVVFWKVLNYEDNSTGKTKTFPMLRYYRVFNIDDLENVPEKYIPKKSVDFDHSNFRKSIDIIKAWNTMPAVFHKSASAYYVPSKDEVHMPNPGDFKTPEAYYATLWHELMHSTGHKKRLNRNIENSFGNHEYSKEELVAELGSAYMCALTGISTPFTEKNNAAYIQSWLKALKNDHKLFFQASSQAQKAADYILAGGVVVKNENQHVYETA